MARLPITGGGHLRSLVRFYERQGLLDGAGNEQGEWVTRLECRAQIDPGSGSEDVMAARLQGKQPVTIRVRQFPQTLEITPDWMCMNVDNGANYAILTIVDPDENGPQHGRWLELMCEAGVALG